MIRRRLAPWLQHEFDQFGLLSRDSVRRLLDSALLAGDTDPSQFALWSLVLLATPPAMYGFRQLVNYSALGFQSAAVIEHSIQIDRMFFLLYGMLVAALVAAGTWEALLPDRDDQEIVGSLPVRSRTLAAARLAAAMWTAAIASATISLPAAAFLAIAAPSHPALGFVPVVFIAHIVATMSASVFVFVMLLVCRASLALCFGAQTSERLATLMQLITISALAEVFFFIPGVIPSLVDRMAVGDPSVLLIPSVPFAAMYAWLVGLRYPSWGRRSCGAAAARRFGGDRRTDVSLARKAARAPYARGAAVSACGVGIDVCTRGVRGTAIVAGGSQRSHFYGHDASAQPSSSADGDRLYGNGARDRYGQRNCRRIARHNRLRPPRDIAACCSSRDDVLPDAWTARGVHGAV